jgi:predicted alpha/beta superfamily hydrolase
MYTTYHFKSAADINMDILNAIKIAFKEKPIMITVEEEKDETDFLMANPINKASLLKSIAQDKNGETISFTIPEEEA